MYLIKLTNLALLYLYVWVTFSFIYLLLDILNLGLLLNPFLETGQQSLISSSLVFSATTLFTDEISKIIPYGFSMPLAFIEGTVGFLIPPFIMAQTLPSKLSP